MGKLNLYGVVIMVAALATASVSATPRRCLSQNIANFWVTDPNEDAPAKQPANRWIVETRLRFEGHWYRLNSGPRNAKEACVLWHGLRAVLEHEHVPHAFTFMDMESGTAQPPGPEAIWPAGFELTGDEVELPCDEDDAASSEQP